MPFCDTTLHVNDRYEEEAENSDLVNIIWLHEKISLSIFTKRVDDILTRLNLTEKIGALGNESPSLDSIGMNSYNWWSEAAHGISHVRNDGIHILSRAWEHALYLGN